MAIPEHVRLLRRGFHVWNLKRPSFPDLFGAQLERLDLRAPEGFVDESLRTVKLGDVGDRKIAGDLTWTDLRSAHLTRVELGWARFNRASLQSAVLVACDLYRADFRGADLRGADLTRCPEIARALGVELARWDSDTQWPSGYTVVGDGQPASQAIEGDTSVGLVWLVQDRFGEAELMARELGWMLPRAQFRVLESASSFANEFSYERNASSGPEVVVATLDLASAGDGDADSVAQLALDRGVPVVGVGRRFESLHPVDLPRFESAFSKLNDYFELAREVRRLLDRERSSDEPRRPSPTRAEREQSDLSPLSPDRSVEHPAPETVAELVPDLFKVDQFDPQATAVILATSEALIGEVRQNLQNGGWSVKNGYPFGFEEDIEGDLNELERQLRPLSGRPPSSMMVQSLIGQLAAYVLDLAEQRASIEERQRVEHLKADVVDRITRLDGTERDVDDAISAVNTLAFATAWDQMEKMPNVTDDSWAAFVDFAESQPAAAAARLVGWISTTRSEIVSGLLAGFTTASTVGFLAQSVAVWIGATTASAAGIGVIAGLVGAVVGAVVGVLAVRFRPEWESAESEPAEPTVSNPS